MEQDSKEFETLEVDRRESEQWQKKIIKETHKFTLSTRWQAQIRDSPRQFFPPFTPYHLQGSPSNHVFILLGSVAAAPPGDPHTCSRPSPRLHTGRCTNLLPQRTAASVSVSEHMVCLSFTPNNSKMNFYYENAGCEGGIKTALSRRNEETRGRHFLTSLNTFLFVSSVNMHQLRFQTIYFL